MKYSIYLSIVFICVCGACSVSAKTGLPQTADNSVPEKNRILNLYDAFGKENPQAVFDFGFCALIEFNGKTILFDSGTDANILKQNAEAFGVDLSTVDFAVGSHSHSDHISGFDYLLEVNPDVKIYLPKDFYGLGAPLTFRIAGTEPEKTQELPLELQYFRGEKAIVEIRPSGRFWKGNVEYVTGNRLIEKGIKLVTTTSPFLGNFNKYPNLDSQGQASDSQVHLAGLPELSLVLENDTEQNIIVGCSHSTVEAIIKEARAYTDKKIALVMGGYHLIPYKSEELLLLASRLKNDLGVGRVAPAHCSGHLAFKILRDIYKERFIPAGLGSEIIL